MPRRFTIGRDKLCDVPLEDDSVSRRHAEIWLSDDGSMRITDLGSSNGTRLIRHGQQLKLDETVIKPGDQIRMGKVTFSVEELMAKASGVRVANPAKRVRCSCGVLKVPGERCPGCEGSTNG